MIGSILLSPVTGLMLVLAAIFLVLNAATALYVPAYLHYVEGCVDPPRNGTFFANNVYSVSYNGVGRRQPRAARGPRRLPHEARRQLLPELRDWRASSSA